MRVLNAVRGGSWPSAPAGGRRPPGRGSPARAAQPGQQAGPAARAGLTAPFARCPTAPPGVDRLGTGLTAVAWTDGEAIAAIELTGPSFAIGMQWHPEQGEDMRIFRTRGGGQPLPAAA